jgi:hypothetical protein
MARKHAYNDFGRFAVLRAIKSDFTDCIRYGI